MHRSWLIYLILLTVILTGCVEKKTETFTQNMTPVGTAQPSPAVTVGRIAFESILKGDSILGEMETPTISVAGSADEAARFIGLLENASAAKRIQETDYNTTWIIAVFRGQMRTSGYGITVEEINFTPGVVQLKVNLTEPSPQQMVSPATSYPYHIILVPRENLPVAAGTIWAVYTTEGKLLAQTQYP